MSGAARGDEREQGAGSSGEAGGSRRRESLAATGKEFVGNDRAALIRLAAVSRQSGGDRRRLRDADSGWSGAAATSQRRRT